MWMTMLPGHQYVTKRFQLCDIDTSPIMVYPSVVWSGQADMNGTQTNHWFLGWPSFLGERCFLKMALTCSLVFSFSGKYTLCTYAMRGCWLIKLSVVPCSSEKDLESLILDMDNTHLKESHHKIYGMWVVIVGLLLRDVVFTSSSSFISFTKFLGIWSCILSLDSMMSLICMDLLRKKELPVGLTYGICCLDSWVQLY